MVCRQTDNIRFAEKLSLTVRFADADLTSVVVSFVLYSVFTVRAYDMWAHCQIKIVALQVADCDQN